MYFIEMLRNQNMCVTEDSFKIGLLIESFDELHFEEMSLQSLARYEGHFSVQTLSYWKCNFHIAPSVHLLVDWSVDLF